MFRIRMDSRSYANVPTSDSVEIMQNGGIPLTQMITNVPLKEIPQTIAIGPHLTKEMQEKSFNQPPPTPPRNPSYLQMMNMTNQQVKSPLPPIPHSPLQLTSPADNPYEEVPHVRTLSGKRLDAERGGGGDSPDGENRSSQPEADQQFMRSSSTTGMLQDKERAPRKKKNPTYEGFQDVPYQRKTQDIKSEETESSDFCQCVKNYSMTIIILFLALLALVLVVLMISGVLSTGAVAGETAAQVSEDLSPEKLEHRIHQLEALNLALLERVVQMEGKLSGGQANASINTKLAQTAIKITELSQNFTSQKEDISQVSDEVDVVKIIANSNKEDLADVQQKSVVTDVEIQQLRYQIGNLSEEVASKDSTRSGQITNLQQQITDHSTEISDVHARLNNVESSFSMQLTGMNASVYNELDMISKMPGPRGYNGSDGQAGAGDLSACKYVDRKGGSGVNAVTETTPLSADENYTIVGVTCTSDVGTVINLEKTDAGSYICQCNGLLASPTVTSQRYCTIHTWQCPTNG